YTQGNLAILPRECSEEFLHFAQLNPKSCPLIGVTEPGSSRVPELGDIDLKTDLPSYWVFRDGHMAEQVNDLTHLWRDDLVGFVIGCSYSFEDALRDAGVPVRHIDEGRGAPMFIT
ncbi:D-glutamate cyclase family protein, partial [Burkholderia sola]|uniref:D-glutamate cyclase family protein n=1 Tax=Burkholderia sola TaxID=2843302 RepID=UPI00338F2F69